jgi:hypothetical protein
MLSTIRRHINATTVVAFIALVFAMTGGAFAMNSGTQSSKATASVNRPSGGPRASNPAVAAAAKSKAKPKAGPRGPAGPAGKNGAAGPTGPAGPIGPTGAAGAQGATGTAGTTGPAGPTGASGTTGFTETLPSGKTEKGVWAWGVGGAEFRGYAVAEISFTIPLAAELDKEHVHIVALGEEIAETCEGSVEEPSAAKGNLCVYERSTSGVEEGPFLLKPSGTPFLPEAGAGAGKSGAIVFALPQEGKGSNGYGTWAVTAP